METSNRAYGQNERGAKQKALLFLSNDHVGQEDILWKRKGYFLSIIPGQVRRK